MEHDNTTIPNRFQVAVILTRQPSRSRWVSHIWKARGVVVGAQEVLAQAAGQRVRSDPDGSEDYLWSGIPLHLYKDQVESYARRKGMAIAEAERWLAPVLNYDV